MPGRLRLGHLELCDKALGKAGWTSLPTKLGEPVRPACHPGTPALPCPNTGREDALKALRAGEAEDPR